MMKPSEEVVRHGNRISRNRDWPGTMIIEVVQEAIDEHEADLVEVLQDTLRFLMHKARRDLAEQRVVRELQDVLAKRDEPNEGTER